MLMSNPPDPRIELARRQAELVRALSGGEVPQGFDSSQLTRASESLLLKRAGMIRKAWPALAASLGDRLIELCSSYAAMSPPPNPIERDGLQFARWLCERKLFPAQAQVELAIHQVGLGFPFRLLIVRNDRRLVLVYRIIRVVRVFSLRWGLGV